jgi:hypothetical protein
MLLEEKQKENCANRRANDFVKEPDLSNGQIALFRK